MTESENKILMKGEKMATYFKVPSLAGEICVKFFHYSKNDERKLFHVPMVKSNGIKIKDPSTKEVVYNQKLCKYTKCVIEQICDDERHVISQAFAICSPRDQFNKKTGRIISVCRAAKKSLLSPTEKEEIVNRALDYPTRAERKEYRMEKNKKTVGAF